MSKLWTFGDSFTHGDGLVTPNRDPFWYGTKYKDYHWPNLLANSLGLKLENLSHGGMSNEGILHQCIGNLKNFNSGDTIVLGMSTPERMKFFSYDREMDFNATSLGVLDIWEKDGKKGVHPYSELYTYQEICSIRDLYLTIHPKYSEVYHNKYLRLFNSLAIHLQNVGFQVIVWDYTIWEEFENIQEWTENLGNKRVNDGHWSPNGSKTFFNVVKYQLDKKQNSITLDIVKELKLNQSHLFTSEYVKSPIYTLI